jgi:hypothetical protein
LNRDVDVMADHDRKKNNRRMALILASIALVIFVGFIAKFVLLGN